MNSIPNALIRIEGVTSSVFSPFEKPSNKHDFWVLEIPLRQKADMAEFCVAAKAVLKKTWPELKKLHSEGCEIILFFETQGYIALDRELVFLLGQIGARIEVSKPV